MEDEGFPAARVIKLRLQEMEHANSTAEPLSDAASFAEVTADVGNIALDADGTFKMRRLTQKVHLPNDSVEMYRRVCLLESTCTSSPRPSGGENDEAKKLEKVCLIDGVLQEPRAEKLKAVLDEVYFEKGFGLHVGKQHLGTCYFAKVSARSWARRAWTMTFREGALLPRFRPTW